MHQILQSYLRRLTNLSSNNRSLFLPRLIGNQYLDVHQLEHLNSFSAFKLIEWLIAGGQHDLEGADEGVIPLCPIVDSRHASGNAVSQQLKKLARTETFFREEQGSQDLYVGWPFVRGKFTDGTLVRCPLLFFPVSLRQHHDPTLGHQWVLTPRIEVALSLNKSFLLAYAYYNQLDYDDTLAERTFDDFDRDSRIFRTSLYQLFKESLIELNFNQEIFVDALYPFQEFTKATLEEKEKTGELKLYPEAVLGIFPQAGSYLVPDYLKLIDSERVPDLESFFLRRSSAEQQAMKELESVDETLVQPTDIRQAYRVKEEQIFTPYRLDAYQEKALRQIKQGDSLVVQGPPGTGKSQLIVNLIADYAAQGKRVLLVCQKRAALDVVYDRLRARDVHPFVARVHDFKNDRRAVYEQISKQIDAIYEYQLKNNSLDSIFMERNFLQYSRRIEQICEELDDFKQALFDEREAGVSVKELYLTCDLNAPSINVKQEYQYFPVPELPAFLRKLRTYTNYAVRLDDEHHVLSSRKSFANYSVEDYQQMRALAERVPVFKSTLTEKVSSILGTDIDFVTCQNMQHQSPDIARWVEVLAEDRSYRYFQDGYPNVNPDVDPLWLANIERVIHEGYEGEGPEVSLAPDELGTFQGVLSQAEEARSGAAQWAWWKLFSKEKEYVQRVFDANDLALDKAGFARMIARLDARLNLEHNLTKLREQSWTQEVPAWETNQYDQAHVSAWFHHQQQALEAALLFHSFRNFNEYFAVRHHSYPELKSKAERLLVELATIPDQTKAWAQYYTPAQVAQLNAPEQSQRLIKVLEQDFDALADFDTLKNDLLPYEVQVIQRLFEQVKSLEATEVLALFENSIRLTWIDHIETKYPVLRIVSSDQLSTWEQELQQAIEDKLAISQEILLMKLRERTYYDVEYNRLSNMVTYRDLNHQINKKRKVWPLRKVVENFQSELFNLVPCWLASPETVSAIFPMDESPLFDLVIFDEASQCFAEKGIPAMYRGQQVVVVGDSRQLSPNDLYTARWEDTAEPDTGEDAIALEANSLLDLAQNYLASVRLEGHYRSRSLDLIGFSNHHFYEDRLRMLPDFTDANRHQPAIAYVRVEGRWEQQTNAVESERVVALVRQLTQESPDKTLGVITFNRRQQELIQDTLDQAALEHDWTRPDTLFVKNIENVQGDERDVIIFSIGYAPNEQGKMSVQFGSLNATGGENRLNVAVTRAREQVYVVTSIRPHQLEVATTKNAGPKLLKAYLEYAQLVSEGQYRPTVPVVSSRHPEWFLFSRLYQYTDEHLADYQAVRSLPYADLTLEERDTDPVHYVGLIHTDDDLYYQSTSAKDMHAYRPHLYRQKDWKFKHFYSRQFWNNQELVKEALQRFAQTRGEKV